jgi:hypothetical protein
MNGELQKFYEHSVEKGLNKEDRRGTETPVCRDTGRPVDKDNLTPVPRTWAYTTVDPPGLHEGNTYSYRQLVNFPIHS